MQKKIICIYQSENNFMPESKILLKNSLILRNISSKNSVYQEPLILVFTSIIIIGDSCQRCISHVDPRQIFFALKVTNPCFFLYFHQIKALAQGMNSSNGLP